MPRYEGLGYGSAPPRRPLDARRLNGLGLRAHRAGQFAKAAELFEKAVERARGHPMARYNLACAKARLRDVPAAAELMLPLLLLDLPRFAPRFRDDSDLRALRESTPGKGLLKELERLEPLWVNALQSGVPAIMAIEHQRTSSECRDPDTGDLLCHPDYADRRLSHLAGSYLIDESRFVPNGLRGGRDFLWHAPTSQAFGSSVATAWNAAGDNTEDMVSLTIHQPGRDSLHISYDAVVRKAFGIDDDEHLGLHSPDYTPGFATVLPGQPPLLLRLANELGDDRSPLLRVDRSTAKAVTEPVPDDRATLLVGAVGIRLVEPTPEGLQLKGRQLRLADGRTFELARGHAHSREHSDARQAARQSLDGRWVVVVSNALAPSVDDDVGYACSYWPKHCADAVDLEAGRVHHLSCGRGVGHAHFSKHGQLLLQSGSRVRLYSSPFQTPVDLPDGVRLVPEIRDYHVPNCG
jgi:hypothetical protein